jgi:hypothetical protein
VASAGRHLFGSTFGCVTVPYVKHGRTRPTSDSDRRDDRVSVKVRGRLAPPPPPLADGRLITSSWNEIPIWIRVTRSHFQNQILGHERFNPRPHRSTKPSVGSGKFVTDHTCSKNRQTCAVSAAFNASRRRRRANPPGLHRRDERLIETIEFQGR